MKGCFALSHLLVSYFLLFSVLFGSSLKKFKVSGSQVLGHESWVLGPGILGLRSWVPGPRFWVLGPGFSGSGSWALGLRVPGFRSSFQTLPLFFSLKETDIRGYADEITPQACDQIIAQLINRLKYGSSVNELA